MGRTSRSAEDRGAVMVELALVLPILVLLLVGIIEFGQVYNNQIAIQAAAREGARALALGQSAGTVDTVVRNAAGGAAIGSISQSGCPTSPTVTSRASVTVTATHTFSIPFIDLGSRTFDATASMRCGL